MSELRGVQRQRTSFGIAVALAAITAADGPAAGERSTGAAEGAAIVVAQADTGQRARLTVEGLLRGEPGQRIKLALSVWPSQADAGYSVVVRGLPEQASLSQGRKVGAGAWLIGVRALSETMIEIGRSAPVGRTEVLFELVTADGRIMAADAAMLTILAGPGAGGTSAARSLAQAPAEAPAVADSSRTAAVAAALANAAPPPLLPPSGRAAPAAPPTLNRIETGPAAKVAVLPATRPPFLADDSKLEEYARYLVKECTTCHSLFGRDQGIPVMIGLPVDRFLEHMKQYANGQRDHSAMASVARSLDDDQMQVLAIYLGRIKPPPAEPAAVRAPPVDAPKPQPDAQLSENARRWLARGEQLLKAGDLAQARGMLERAAEGGSAAAALLVGATFDPNRLMQMGLVFVEADVKQARQWYEFAARLGAKVEADSRIAALPAR